MSHVEQASALASKVCSTCGLRAPADALFCPQDGSPLTRSRTSAPADDDAYVGLEIAGHIEIKQLVGVGAMGRVYRAFQRGIDRDVAVKVLHHELSNNAQLVTRFTREAKVASKLVHPNVVQVLLSGQLPDGALYMVMEYLDGLSLQSALAGAGGALPLPRALHIALQICDAVGEAHAQGIVHRDLKPENVMLVRRGEDPDYVKVLDFGIARIDWGEQSMATAAGLIFGTARYISPEGAQGQAVGPQGDVYALATLVYQMLSGKTPFDGEQAVALLVQQIHDPPPSLRQIARAAYVPDPLAEAVMRNLGKSPAERDEDARAFGRALLDAARAARISLEELSRPMLVGRPSSPVHLSSIEATQQLDLTPELEARMNGHASWRPGDTEIASDDGATRDATPGPNGEGRRGKISGNATAKWVPPPDVQARMVKSEPAQPAATPAAPASGVETTMDDVVSPGPTVRLPPPSPTAAPPAAPSRPRTDYAAPSPGAFRAPVRPPARGALPSSGADAATDDEDAGRRGRPRTFAIVFLCFLLGVGVAVLVAYRMGRIGPDAGREDFVRHAQDAMYKHRIVEPPGENVRDLTTEGLRRWPGDTRLVEIRSRAAQELVSQATLARAAGDVGEAQRLVKLARDLDPADGPAARLEHELADAPTTPAPSVTAAPPLPLKPVASPGTAGPQPTGAPSTVAQVRATLDPSTVRPRTGQPVEFVGRLVPHGKGKIERPEFVVTGPGLPNGARIPGAEEGGAYHAGFTFFEAGHFDVVFSITVDGVVVRAARSIVSGEPGPPATASPSSSGGSPPPSASVKWM